MLKTEQNGGIGFFQGMEKLGMRQVDHEKLKTVKFIKSAKKRVRRTIQKTG